MVIIGNERRLHRRRQASLKLLVGRFLFLSLSFSVPSQDMRFNLSLSPHRLSSRGGRGEQECGGRPFPQTWRELAPPPPADVLPSIVQVVTSGQVPRLKRVRSKGTTCN